MRMILIVLVDSVLLGFVALPTRLFKLEVYSSTSSVSWSSSAWNRCILYIYGLYQIFECVFIIIIRLNKKVHAFRDGKESYQSSWNEYFQEFTPECQVQASKQNELMRDNGYLDMLDKFITRECICKDSRFPSDRTFSWFACGCWGFRAISANGDIQLYSQFHAQH